MSPPRTIIPAAAGFAFVAVAFAQSLLIAVACLLGAAAFHVVYGVATGTLSVDELRERAEAARSGFAGAVAPDGPEPGHRRRVS